MMSPSIASPPRLLGARPGGALVPLLLGCLALAGCREKARERGDEGRAAAGAAGAPASEGAPRRAADESEGIDTTGLAVPGADTIPAKTVRADSLLAVVGDAPSMGRENAAVVIVEFSDFECPFCTRVHGSLKRLMQNRPDIRLVYVQYPLVELHRNARLAAEASLEAHRQGKFWDYHDALFQHGPPLTRSTLLEAAKKVGLDVEALRKALDQGTHRARVDEEVRLGEKLGVTGTPTFFVNGYKLVGARSYETFVAVYNLLLRASRRAELAQDGSPS